MTVLQALVLGLLQGLSEFLPISSSAHLTLAPWLFHWTDPGLSFDVALHFGTLLAVLWYFRREAWDLIVSGLRVLRTMSVHTPQERRALHLAIATVPAVFAGLALDKYAEAQFRSPVLIACTLIAMGVVLWASDRFVARTRTLDDMRWQDALWIGVAQTFALVPGVSRSGATITTGRLLSLDRKSAAVFSFLLSMPVIAGAAALKMPDAIRSAAHPAPLIVGVLAAAISGWLAIDGILRFVARHSYGVFAVYRLVLGIFVLVVAAIRA